MKKIIGILSLVIAMICSNNAYAELPEISEPTFERGDLIGSLTVGYGWGFSQRLAVEYGVAGGWIDDRASLGVGAALAIVSHLIMVIYGTNYMLMQSAHFTFNL